MDVTRLVLNSKSTYAWSVCPVCVCVQALNVGIYNPIIQIHNKRFKCIEFTPLSLHKWHTGRPDQIFLFDSKTVRNYSALGTLGGGLGTAFHSLYI